MERTVGVVSLGCAKNLVDSELMLGFLKKDGWQVTPTPQDADYIVVNTCGFIESAKQESIDTILEMARYKTAGRCRGLVVTGCLSQRYLTELQQELPEVDAMVGVNQMDQMPTILSRLDKGETVFQADNHWFDYNRDDLPDRVLASGSHVAYLKIAEGCSHACAFCAIPHIRGPYRSRQPGVVIREAKQLVQSGVQELIVIAQDITAYGQDLPETSLVDLLQELVCLDAVWIRLLYTYPTRLSDDLLQLIADEKKIVNYVDLPLQHTHPAVLRRMGRPQPQENYERLIERIRRIIPDVVLRSSFIVGFPGETEAEYQTLLDFLTRMRLHHAGIFSFSSEDGTAAATMPQQLSEEVKQARRHGAMDVQRRISLQYNRALVGQVLPVLIDGPAESELVVRGRTFAQAPDVDGVVYVGDSTLKPGDLVPVRIVEAHPYDLVGEVVNEDAARNSVKLS